VRKKPAESAHPTVVGLDYQALSRCTPEERFEIVRSHFYGPLVRSLKLLMLITAVVSAGAVVWMRRSPYALSTAELVLIVVSAATSIAFGLLFRLDRRFSRLRSLFVLQRF
jgi:hypothetical protein